MHGRRNIVEPLVLAIASGLFFALFYKGHLLFQEQMAFLPMTWESVRTAFLSPGGFAAVLGRLAVQFYRWPWVAAAIAAGIIVAVQQLSWKAACVMRVSDVLYPLSFIPAFWTWGFLCDVNAVLGGVMAFLLVMVVFAVADTVRGPQPEAWYAMVFIPAISLIIFWICGPVFMLFPLLWTIRSARPGSGNPRTTVIGLLVFSFVMVVLAFGAGPRIFPYSSGQIMAGVGYYRHPGEKAYYGYVLYAMVLALTMLGYLPRPKVKRPSRYWTLHAVCVCVALLAGYLTVSSKVDMEAEADLQYDQALRREQWDKVLEMACRRPPQTYLSLACVNHALAQTNRMGEGLFDYRQQGMEGLIPGYHGEAVLPFTVADIYYHLGLINESRYLAFEAGESAGDMVRSVRAFQRLALCEAVNGQALVSKKYANLVNQSLLYKNWEDRAISPTHLVELQRNRLKDSLFFSYHKLPELLSRLVRQRPANRMAADYLLAWTLLEKQWEHFPERWDLCRKSYGEKIPVIYQQALLFAAVRQSGNPKVEVEGVEACVKTAYEEFDKVLSGHPAQQARAMLEKTHGRTYWYYHYFNF